MDIKLLGPSDHAVLSSVAPDVFDDPLLPAALDEFLHDPRHHLVVAIDAGFVVGFAHDWANIENTFRSWDMVARYVVPEINGYIAGLRRSQKYVIENRESFERAGQAVMAKIMENDKAAAALAVTRTNRFAVSSSNAPDLEKAQAKKG